MIGHVTAQNLEDAANIATEFIYSLENLPNEVKHLLEEIRIKDVRAQELQQQIDIESAKYVRNGLRTNSIPPSPSSSPSGKNNANIPAKIASAYAEIHQLSNEKCHIADRLIDLIRRTGCRLDVDLAKVRVLQGEEPPVPLRQPTTPMTLSSRGDMVSGYGRDPAAQLNENMRNALTPTAASAPPPSASATSISTGPANKKRRIAATTSAPLIKLPAKTRSISPMPPPPVTKASQSQSRSRLSRQVVQQEDEELEEDDAEGEDDMEGEDDNLYCFCRKKSFGDMIACDNENNCPYEWFHLPCVGVKQPMPEVWYCSACAETLAQPGGRKARKK